MSFGQRGGYNRGGFGSSSSGGGFRSFKPKPVEVGKEYDVTISDISRRGDGIAKIDGFVIFVAGAKQGQTVRIKVTQVSNRYASGQLVDGSMAAASSEESSSEEESTEDSTEQ
ncbi:MAG: TRAM domain-containing protein [Nitrososphaerota archaeon]|jgi:predicted RNA-binding protein with TRAM domain|nr:TRAM domain-containing protein [Nitrososphaerota archaeon]